jgi:serine/threonine protein kinase/tetratricopeptide (TPR) repeat protein
MTSRQLIANRFEIQDLLGRGGMGNVYRATDTQTGEIVAVKALNPEILARDPSLLERFVREGKALRQLNHPNIVRMVAAVEEEGHHYLVMEYVGGGSLQDLLATNERLPNERVIQIALEVADALTRAHHLGIIHRDLKPANVLLAEDGTPRLTDFGIAYIADTPHLTQTGVLVGTVDYLCPEACNGEKLDERADIWSFGVMLFQMLAGCLPFTGESLTSKLTAILTQPVPDLAQIDPNISDALADLIYRMLQKDPQQRIPSVRLVGAELEAMLKGWQVVTPSHPVSTGSRFDTPTPSAQRAKHNLPTQLTSFVGRQAELTELARLLNDPAVRLVTILGAGGMGKTRLSLEAGAAQLNHYPNGVYFVPLASIDSSEAIVPATAQALGFSFYEGGEPRQQLLDYLREKSMLLILDNFEHLLSGVDLVGEILNTAPPVKILSTSRARLNVQGEQLFHLSGMDFPDWETPADAMEYSAVKLFLQSARRVRPDFELTPDNLKYVARICKLVEGMPLGILLAASWVEMLALEEIAKEIEKNLDFLETEQRDLPDRQHSMRAVFDYSWNLLTPGEQEVFKKLSVFRGGFTREAAQQVTGASLRELMGLVDKSLLQRSSSGRYGIHELLRQYAAEKLARAPEDEQACKDRHCTYYAKFLQQRETRLVSKEQKQVLPEIIIENENLRAAWDWAVSRGKIEEINCCLESLAETYRIQGWFKKGEEVVGSAVQMLSGDQEGNAHPESRLVLGKALVWQGRFCESLGLEEKVEPLFQASLVIFRDLGALREVACALSYLGGCGGTYGSDSPEDEQCLEALAIFKEIGDQRGIALSLNGLAWAKLHQGNYILSKKYFQDSLALFRKVDNREGITKSLSGLGYNSWILGEYPEAKQLHQVMLSLCRETGDQEGISRSIGNLGIDAIGLREYEEARRLFQESLALYKETGDKRGVADELGDLGELANIMGEYLAAAQFAQESLELYREVYHVDVSWPVRVLGNAVCRMGTLLEARDCLHRALMYDVSLRRMSLVILDLIGIASLMKAEGKMDKGLELLTLVIHHPISWQMAKDQAAPLIAKLEAELPPDIVAAAKERGRARDLESTIAELLAELGDSA